MTGIKIRFLGSSDNFASGARLQPCILVKGENRSFLIDCGATCLVSMRKYDVNPLDIDFIIISHLHGDHFCGIPFFILEAQLISRRKKTLKIAGPQGTEDRITRAMEIMYPGSSAIKRDFNIEYFEIIEKNPCAIDNVEISCRTGIHPAGDPSLIIRADIKTSSGVSSIVYTGDTEWTDVLPDICRGADVLIAEAYFYEKKIKNHLDYKTLHANSGKLGADRIIITHMSTDMLDNLDESVFDHAEDGREFIIPPKSPAGSLQ